MPRAISAACFALAPLGRGRAPGSRPAFAGGWASRQASFRTNGPGRRNTPESWSLVLASFFRRRLFGIRMPEPPHVVGPDSVLFVPDQHQVSFGLLESAAHGLRQTQPRRMTQRADLRILQGQVPSHVERIVRRSVVNDQQFEAAGQLGQDVKNLGDLTFQTMLGVVDRQQNGDGRFQVWPRWLLAGGAASPLEMRIRAARPGSWEGRIVGRRRREGSSSRAGGVPRRQGSSGSSISHLVESDRLRRQLKTGQVNTTFTLSNVGAGRAACLECGAADGPTERSGATGQPRPAPVC